VDLTPRVDTEMAAWLKSKGYRVGKCERGDFFATDESRKFDVVYSNGFIEHFTKWEDVLLKHARLVKPGGLLMVSVPNFVGGFQSWFHQTLDHENYERHFTPSMNPEKWIQVLGDSFEVVSCEYFSEFGFWIGEQKRTLVQKLAFWTLRAMLPVLRLLPKNKKLYSPYCGLVARKRV
jgi:SAM-dependent methyltransferase